MVPLINGADRTLRWFIEDVWGHFDEDHTWPGALLFSSERDLLLDDIDLGNRRIVIAGHARPPRLAGFSAQPLAQHRQPSPTDYSADCTGGRSCRTALGHRGRPPASGHPVTPPRRPPLEEALTHGPDPLHLSVVFGLDEKTAIRYAAAARQLLENQIEHDT